MDVCHDTLYRGSAMVLQTHIRRDDDASQLSRSTATISAAAYSALVIAGNTTEPAEPRFTMTQAPDMRDLGVAMVHGS